MYGKILANLDSATERAENSPFNRDEFGLASFPHHRTLADAIVACDPLAAEKAVNELLDSVIVEIEKIIAGRPAKKAAAANAMGKPRRPAKLAKA